MKIEELSLTVPFQPNRNEGGLLDHFRASVEFQLQAGEIPIRFTVSSSSSHQFTSEIGVISDAPNELTSKIDNLFEFRKRKIESADKFNAVFLVPTGIGAEIGGHAGDATAIAKLLAEQCDKLVLHPNIVNASDINEQPGNALYVEGSIITRLLMGTAGLQSSRANRILVILDDHPDKHFVNAAINSVNASRAIYGLDCNEIICLNPPIRMVADYADSGRAVGRVERLEPCLDVLTSKRGEYDAVAIASVIRVPHEYHLDYFESEGSMVNPWGGVEAMLTHAISSIFDVPTAHSPMFESRAIENLESGVVDPRMAAEAVSMSFLNCTLKGLQNSPRIVSDESLFARSDVLSAEDISCLIIPEGCLGLPTLAALEQGISVIAVRENKNLMDNDLSLLPWSKGKYFLVDNYLEAVGVMSAIKAGITIDSVRRPFNSASIRSVSDSIDTATSLG